jgi:hypothetical protein
VSCSIRGALPLGLPDTLARRTAASCVEKWSHRSVEFTVTARGCRLPPRAAERHHHSDAQIEGGVGYGGARAADVLLSAHRSIGRASQGHARAAERGIATIFRRLYDNPDGPGRTNEWDFVTYFECADVSGDLRSDLPVATRRAAEPEWRYVTEGSEWRGRRVLRW